MQISTASTEAEVNGVIKFPKENCVTDLLTFALLRRNRFLCLMAPTVWFFARALDWFKYLGSDLTYWGHVGLTAKSQISVINQSLTSLVVPLTRLGPDLQPWADNLAHLHPQIVIWGWVCSSYPLVLFSVPKL